MPRTPLLVGSLAIVIAACGESAWLRRCLRLPAGPRIASLDEGAVRLESVPESCAEGTSAVEAALSHTASRPRKSAGRETAGSRPR